jgi:hypothetical protein
MPPLPHAAHVLLASDWLQVVRVHAQGVQAEMVQFQAVRDLLDQELIGIAVSADMRGSQPECTIAVLADAVGSPHPARAEFGPMFRHGPILGYLAPETLLI